MTKQELISAIQVLNSNDIIVFVEVLDTGENNRRTMGCTHEHSIALIQSRFDDSLYGHFGDEIWTTIYDLKIIEVE